MSKEYKYTCECGHVSRSPFDKFCEECGKKLDKEEHKIPCCPKCNTTDFGDNFCYRCGYDYGRK